MPQLKSFNGILGNDSLKLLNAVIYTANNYMLVNNSIKVKILQQESQSVNILELRINHLPQSQAEKLQSLCENHPNLFTDPDEKLTFTTTVKAEIKTPTDNPIYSRYYPYPMAMKDEVEKQINELLDQGIIRRSKSPYNSPI